MALSRSMKDLLAQRVNQAPSGGPRGPGSPMIRPSPGFGGGNRYPTTSPGVGQTAYRPGYTPPTNYVSAGQSQARAKQQTRAKPQPPRAGFPGGSRARGGFPEAEPGSGSGRRYAQARAARDTKRTQTMDRGQRFAGRQGPYGGRGGPRQNLR